MARTHRTKKLKNSTKNNATATATPTPAIKKKILKKKHKSDKPKTITITDPPQPTTAFDTINTETTGTDPIEPDSDPVDIPALLEPYTKEQLIDLISTAAADNRPLRDFVLQHADRDVSHRKIFVRGLPWNASNETVLSEFRAFGEVVDCKVVTDKATGRAKGYGFLVFKTRKGAQDALKEPKKVVNNRVWSWQLASVGPVNSASAASTQPPAPAPAPAAAVGTGAAAVAAPVVKDNEQDAVPRKIYVSNVGKITDKERFRVFFSRFGEIEAGPMGFDPVTGRSKGYALIIYKTAEGARKVLEEPYKVFEGQQLHCALAKERKNNDQPAEIQQLVQQQQVQLQLRPQAQQVQLRPQAQQVQLLPQQKQQQQRERPQQQQPPAAQGQMLAVAQNLALFGRHPGLNPLYSGLVGNSVVGSGGSSIGALVGNSIAGGNGTSIGALVGNSIVGSAAGGAISALMGNSIVGGGIGSMIVPPGGFTQAVMQATQVGALLGNYRVGQGLQSVYPNMHLGQAGISRGQGLGGSFAGYPSYTWHAGNL